MLKCDKCGGAVPEGSSFCPHCADPITADDTVIKSVTSNDVAQVQITFGYSSSANYEPAVEMCQRLPTYFGTGEGSAIKHTIAIPITEIELLINIFELVGSWKSSRMLINGQAATKSALVYHGAGCYRDCLKAYNRRMYCFGEKEYDLNIWGCKRLGMSILWGEWMKYGKMSRQGIWTFDKERIRHDLEVAIHEVALCPLLDKKRIMETLEKLPDSIDPKVDKNWQYWTEYQDTASGGYKEVATGVRPLLKKASGYVIGEFRPDWGAVIASQNGQSIGQGSSPQARTNPPGANTVTSKSSCMLVMVVGFMAVLGLIHFLI